MSAVRVVAPARREAREAMSALYASLRSHGLGAPSSADGHLIRPLLSMAGAEALGRERDGAFRAAAGAVQLAHEASLLHDDVIDEAAVRRSEPTLAAARGVASALVQGDHLLTTSYRLAAAAESPTFVALFARAVERTVAGEKQQGGAAGLVSTRAHGDASCRRSPTSCSAARSRPLPPWMTRRPQHRYTC